MDVAVLENFNISKVILREQRNFGKVLHSWEYA